MPASLDRPPALPPDVMSQMGGGSQDPLASIGPMLGQQGQQQPGMPGGDMGATPNGALRTMMEPVEKVLRQMARMNDKMQPYVERALNILNMGVQEAMGGPAPGSPQGREAQPPRRPPEGETSMSFPTL